MSRLDKTTKVLDAVLAGEISANQPQAYVSFFDENLEGEDTKGSAQETDLDSTTDATICAAPAVQGFVRLIDTITIYNKDTATVTVIVKVDDGGTETILTRRTLLTLETLAYEHGVGWYIMSVT